MLRWRILPIPTVAASRRNRTRSFLYPHRTTDLPIDQLGKGRRIDDVLKREDHCGQSTRSEFGAVHLQEMAEAGCACTELLAAFVILAVVGSIAATRQTESGYIRGASRTWRHRLPSADLRTGRRTFRDGGGVVSREAATERCRWRSAFVHRPVRRRWRTADFDLVRQKRRSKASRGRDGQ